MKSKLLKVFASNHHLFGDETDPFYINADQFMREDFFEPFAANFLGEKSVFLDVGANIGLTTIIANSHINNGQIYCFEPSPKTHMHLVANTDQLKGSKVVAEHLAVGDGPGFVEFVETGYSAGNHIASENNMVKSHAVTNKVNITSLDQYVEDKNIDNIDLIKIDVEGFEVPVLKGAQKIIREMDAIFYVEFNSWTLIAHGGVSPTVFLDEIIATNYHVYLIKNGTLEKLTSETDFYMAMHYNIVQSGCVSDLVFSKKPIENYVKSSTCSIPIINAKD